jgi:exopolysaccharide biosynthesis predicted pyruvyltransferase EpsI
MSNSFLELSKSAGKSGPQNGKVQTGHERAEAAIKRLQEEITCVLGPELDSVRSLALVDFPDHPNVGDSAIYLGELAWLKCRCGLAPGYVCNVWNFSAEALQQAVPEGPILIHGGGNFCDIWPHHQQLRETVLTTFSGRRIIQLPQTIHFDDMAAQDRVAKKIAAHGNFLLLVRDQTSFDLARSAFRCDVELCPDMALALGPMTQPAEARSELRLLLRTDKERADQNTLPVLPLEAVVGDWLDESADLRERIRRRSGWRTALLAPAHVFDRNHQRERFYRALAAHRVARGLRLLSSSHMIITDRLHGHILCLLLGIPHVVFDNNYGKLGSFIETWTADCGLVARAASLAEALDARRSFGLDVSLQKQFS